MRTHLYWHNYRYFQYEHEMARREANMLLNPDRVAETHYGLIVDTKNRANPKALNRLVYFRGYDTSDGVISTLQADLEKSCVVTGNQKRQSTRYSVHGLHEYKGKFNPQVVRGVLNTLGIPAGSSIFDPFCGSGTTLVESAFGQFGAVGCDMNPLAVFLSNAKLLALSTPAKRLQDYGARILNSYQSVAFISDTANRHRDAYLREWFNEEILENIEKLRKSIDHYGGPYRSIFLALASDLLRDYSLQEPADLRIRRRKTPLPDRPFYDVFEERLTGFLDNLNSSQSVTSTIAHHNRAYVADIRMIGKRPNNWRIRPPYDAAITSPPYATALPYIDTQRLNLVWLGLIEKSELRELEANLTGSREFSGEQRIRLERDLIGNTRGLCPPVYRFCLELMDAIGQDDGFRRQSVPLLMYRYFSDMQIMFCNLLNMMKESAPFALVVGHNRTTLGGHVFDINTPDLLREIAIHCGWQHDESFPLQTYQRYSIHSQNAVSQETLLVLRKN